MAAQGGFTGFPFNVIPCKDERTQARILHKNAGRLNVKGRFKNAGKKKARHADADALFGRVKTYLVLKTHLTRVRASASLTCGLAGIGTGPQTPAPPLSTFCTSLSSALFWPA